MYAILIVDAIGNVREWTRGTKKLCNQLAERLPENGWALHSIVRLP